VNLLSGQLNFSRLVYLTIALGMSVLGYVAISSDAYGLVALPLALIIGIYILTGSIKSLYILTAAVIPFSAELDLPGGIGLVFPGELMFLLLTGLGAIVIVNHTLPKKLLNSFTLLILLHLFWIGFSGIFAEHQLLSFKYLLAKCWFVLPFYILPFYVFREQLDFDHFLKVLIWASFLAGAYVFIKHGLEGWSFSSRTNIGKPFFRNHVNYACLLLMIVPVSIYVYKRTQSLVYLLLVPFFVVCIYVTYARIAYISILVMIIIWLCYRLNVIRTVVSMSIIAVVVACFYFLAGDRLLHYAPDYETTVSHTRFDRLLEASVEFKDISAMERAHRWMAGIEMVEDRPWLGFGPSNFYSCYQPYTINSFQTYVSDNPEKSGIHNYFLMILVEQGAIGLIIFLAIILAFYWKVAALRSAKLNSPIVMLALAWMTGIIVILLLNDMLEVIKLGPFFFLALWIVAKAEDEKGKETM